MFLVMSMDGKCFWARFLGWMPTPRRASRYTKDEIVALSEGRGLEMFPPLVSGFQVIPDHAIDEAGQRIRSDPTRPEVKAAVDAETATLKGTMMELRVPAGLALLLVGLLDMALSHPEVTGLPVALVTTLERQLARQIPADTCPTIRRLVDEGLALALGTLVTYSAPVLSETAAPSKPVGDA